VLNVVQQCLFIRGIEKIDLFLTAMNFIIIARTFLGRWLTHVLVRTFVTDFACERTSDKSRTFFGRRNTHVPLSFRPTWRFYNLKNRLSGSPVFANRDCCLDSTRIPGFLSKIQKETPPKGEISRVSKNWER
jgi:hypothetical protein